MSDDTTKEPTPIDAAVLQQIRSERDFIHDISSPLMIAHGMLDTYLDDPTSEKAQERLDKSMNALERMNKLLRDRRSNLIQQTQDLESE